jgi:hypothetical protein
VDPGPCGLEGSALRCFFYFGLDLYPTKQGIVHMKNTILKQSFKLSFIKNEFPLY